MVRLARGTNDLDELEACTKGLLEVATERSERVALLAELYEIVVGEKTEKGCVWHACEV